MPSRSLLLAACFSLPLSAAMAQNRPGPAYFLHHPTSEPHLGLLLLPAGPLPALSAVAPLPTARAAAAYAPLPTRSGQPSPLLLAEEPALRHDLTGSRAYPSYDPYQNLPETYRKHTLPAVWAEPLLLQLLRSALGR